MTLSPRVGGASSKPTDVSPSPASQRYASNTCVTTKMTYEFFNELIENFTLAQVAYSVTNVPNDPNALKKLLDSLRTGGYNFTVGTVIANIVNIDDIFEKTVGHGVNVDGVLLKDGDATFTGGDITIQHSTNPVTIYHVTGGNIAYNKPRIFASDTNFTIQTRDDANSVVSNDYNIVRNASGATSHSFSIGNVEKLRLDSTGLTLVDNKINFNNDDYIIYDDLNNFYSLFSDGAISNSKLQLGQLVANNVSGGSLIQLVDAQATDETNANPSIDFRFSTAFGGATTRLGQVGFLNTGNKTLTISNELASGDISLVAGSGGEIVLGSNLDVNNNNIYLGTGKLYYTSDDYVDYDDSNNTFTFTADNSIGGSIIRVGSINFGNTNLSHYQVATFTATFYNGTTQITGSSGVANVSSYDARFTRIGNQVTVNISNIVLDVSGACGTTLGSYPALTTTGEFSIRGLPFNALKDATGYYIGYYNGSGNSNAGCAYIIAGTNNIRFSTTGFGASFGIRGVTITYMV